MLIELMSQRREEVGAVARMKGMRIVMIVAAAALAWTGQALTVTRPVDARSDSCSTSGCLCVVTNVDYKGNQVSVCVPDNTVHPCVGILQQGQVCVPVGGPP